MSSDFKYAGFGLVAGMGIATLLITGMFLVAKFAPLPAAAPAPADPVAAVAAAQPSGTPFPAAAPALSNFTPTPTKIPLSPRETASAESVELVEPLITSGPLTNEQRAQLHAVSLRYVAPTIEESIPLAKAINGVGYGHPSNICGPLAIAIMRDANLVSAEVDPHDFWLLNPDVPEDQRILNSTFPEEYFRHIKTKTSINKVDWRAFPLLPGDFLYLHSGSRGNFEHMLVVTRVDSDLRAYAVTNYATEDGFIIAETLLYDPNNPGAGIFYQWTARENALLGSTGFGGFELWRLR